MISVVIVKQGVSEFVAFKGKNVILTLLTSGDATFARKDARVKVSYSRLVFVGL